MNAQTTKQHIVVAAAITIATNHAITDTGAVSIFIMDGIDVENMQSLKKSLTINLPNGNTVQSTHRCNIVIPGLPTILMGHIVPHLAITSLIGIRLLCKTGCKVTFDDMKCNVIYDGKVNLRGNKDPSTDLWTLPIPMGRMGTTPGESILPQPGPCESCAPHPPFIQPLPVSHTPSE